MADASSKLQRGAVIALLLLLAAGLLTFGFRLGLHAVSPDCGAPWSPNDGPRPTYIAVRPDGTTYRPGQECPAELTPPLFASTLLTLSGAGFALAALTAGLSRRGRSALRSRAEAVTG